MSAIGIGSIDKPGHVSVIVIQRAFAHGRSFLNLPILGCSSEGDSGNQTQAFALLQASKVQRELTLLILQPEKGVARFISVNNTAVQNTTSTAEP